MYSGNLHRRELLICSPTTLHHCLNGQGLPASVRSSPPAGFSDNLYNIIDNLISTKGAGYRVHRTNIGRVCSLWPSGWLPFNK